MYCDIAAKKAVRLTFNVVHHDHKQIQIWHVYIMFTSTHVYINTRDSSHHIIIFESNNVLNYYDPVPSRMLLTPAVSMILKHFSLLKCLRFFKMWGDILVENRCNYISKYNKTTLLVLWHRLMTCTLFLHKNISATDVFTSKISMHCTFICIIQLYQK